MDPVAVIGIVGGVLGFLATTVTVVVAYLTSRDKVRYDSRVTILETETASCRSDNDRLRERVAAVEKEHVACQAEAVAARAKFEEADRRAERSAWELGRVEQEVSDLRGQVRDMHTRLPPGA